MPMRPGMMGQDLAFFQSDWLRALSALAVTLGGAIHILASQADAGARPAQPPVVYSILNMTERMADRQACPLDLRDARETIEAGYAAHGHRLEFSPLAEGPEVLLHEIAATVTTPLGAAAPACAWTVRVSFQGQSRTRESLTHPTHTPTRLDTIVAEPHPLIAAPAR